MSEKAKLFALKGRSTQMTRNEALADIEKLCQIGSNQTLKQEENVCGDTQRATRILVDAFECLRQRDPLYGDRRRFRSLAPPPSSVPPG
jgi:hypothetical protein